MCVAVPANHIYSMFNHRLAYWDLIFYLFLCCEQFCSNSANDRLEVMKESDEIIISRTIEVLVAVRVHQDSNRIKEDNLLSADGFFSRVSFKLLPL